MKRIFVKAVPACEDKHNPNEKQVYFVPHCDFFTKKTPHRYVDIPGGKRSRLPKFKGAVVDTGAERSCVGLPQAKSYCSMIRKDQELNPTKCVFRFGDSMFESKGTRTIKIPTSGKQPLVFRCDVVQVDVPLLLGLDILKRERVVIDISNLIMTGKDWSLPLTLSYGHLVATWRYNVSCTRKKFIKLHRHFRHPSANKLYSLLKRVNPKELKPKTLEVLKDIQKRCEKCSKLSRKPMRMQVGSIDTNEIVFNREISMDLCWIDSGYVLHVIDLGTRYVLR